MIIIGEKINSSLRLARSAMEARNTDALTELAKTQHDAGADFIDINAGTFLEKEPEVLAFLAETLRGLGYMFSVDTPSADAAQAALKALGGRGHLINSVTVEPERLRRMTELAAEYGCGVVALCMQEANEADSIDGRLRVAERLVDHLTQNGIACPDIYIDPMLKPLGADPQSGTDALETLRRLHAQFPDCHLSVGLSNLSYGLPQRRLVNRAFAAAAMPAGLDTVIADPFDRELMGLIAACDAVIGRDEYCLDYIDKCREGLIG